MITLEMMKKTERAGAETNLDETRISVGIDMKGGEELINQKAITVLLHGDRWREDIQVASPTSEGINSMTEIINPGSMTETINPCSMTEIIVQSTMTEIINSNTMTESIAPSTTTEIIGIGQTEEARKDFETAQANRKSVNGLHALIVMVLRLFLITAQPCSTNP
jgi:hypothetical protein